MGIMAMPTLAGVGAFLGLTVLAPTVPPHDWYFINGEAATQPVALQMAARGLPFGDYWLHGNGNWGMAGSADAMGNIHGRRPSLSDRAAVSGGEPVR